MIRPNYSKNLAKNHQLFTLKRLGDYPSLLTDSLSMLFREFTPKSKIRTFKRFTDFTTYQILESYNREQFIRRERKLRSMKREKRERLQNEIQKTLNKLNFGQEWYNTFIDIVLFRYYCSPLYDVFLVEENRNGRKRIILEVGPETSLRDIELIFESVKDYQKKLWPKYSKSKFKPNGMKQLNSMVNYRADLYHDKNNKRTEKKVKTYREVLAESLDDKTEEIVDVDKKELNNFKKRMSRMRKVTRS